MSKLSYIRDKFDEKFITSPEIYTLIKEDFPGYEASGYLGGSILHTSYKWFISAQVGSKSKIFGSVGKRTMEISQIFHHLFNGTYLAYLSDSKIGSKIFFLSPVDKTLRKAYGNWIKHVLRNPLRLFEPVRLQSIGIIQAPDILPDGRADMCDSCPDITIFDGKLVNSCRMDEYRLFGGFVSVISKENNESVKVP